MFHLNSFLFSLLLICHCSNLYHVYSNNYNNNYSFLIFICLESFATNICSLFYIQLRCLNMQLHTRLTELQLAVVCFVLPFCRARSVTRIFFKLKFLFSPSRELYCDCLYMCILLQIFPSCLLLMVYLKVVRCIY